MPDPILDDLAAIRAHDEGAADGLHDEDLRERRLAEWSMLPAKKQKMRLQSHPTDTAAMGAWVKEWTSALGVEAEAGSSDEEKIAAMRAYIASLDMGAGAAHPSEHCSETRAEMDASALRERQ